MKTQVQPDAAVIPTTSIGRSARRTLSPDRDGEVLAVFRRSFYVRFGDDLVCVGPAELEAGPLNILYARGGEQPWSDRLATGAAANCRSAMLCVGSICCFDCTDTPEWQPAHPGRTSPATIHNGLAALVVAIKSHTPGGLGSLIVPMLTDTPVAADDALLRTAGPAIEQLQRSLFAADDHGDAVAEAVSRLVGLGPGLTPSGDDVLGGLMAGLQFFGRAPLAADLARIVLPAAKAGTNLIAQAHLGAAASGQLSAPLWDMLLAIAHAGAGLGDALVRVAKIGHSSGWDTLTGAAIAAKAASAPGAAARPAGGPGQ